MAKIPITTEFRINVGEGKTVQNSGGKVSNYEKGADKLFPGKIMTKWFVSQIYQVCAGKSRDLDPYRLFSLLIEVVI